MTSETNIDKSISNGKGLVFSTNEIKNIRIDFMWNGSVGIDICAFLLGKDNRIHDKADLVYFNSELRWKTKKDLNDHQFNPLDGKISTWAKNCANFKNKRKWMDETLPTSSDGSVIGPLEDMDMDMDMDMDTDTKCSETIYMRLDVVDTQKYASIVFAAAVVEEGSSICNFKDVHNPVINIYDADTEELLAKYKLFKQFTGKDIVRFGKTIYDSNSLSWSFEPMAEGNTGGMTYLANEVFN